MPGESAMLYCDPEDIICYALRDIPRPNMNFFLRLDTRSRLRQTQLTLFVIVQRPQVRSSDFQDCLPDLDDSIAIVGRCCIQDGSLLREVSFCDNVLCQ